MAAKVATGAVSSVTATISPTVVVSARTAGAEGVVILAVMTGVVTPRSKGRDDDGGRGQRAERRPWCYVCRTSGHNPERCPKLQAPAAGAAARG
ncbi:hypothetical protein SARC_09271 [Sphaeroforma arctica JP610]|uniref:CCHC-type domain-containing protein n=1 Tax=Sphaeroforma arctica JP610 TaxID=667725 RepID=A0A0L0FQK6_9EUKA|nr:hypothetical protein SARC_09271 [Sphaeroforma arctica JP610]KNC78293.1 hypothetical protein SARC_09271 [Sphaeroforma arctica JP610]|eukprot:XP_014152195.1 hypothetical protein SARC_09271 [Sphaeroforma arctica JP610]